MSTWGGMQKLFEPWVRVINWDDIWGASCGHSPGAQVPDCLGADLPLAVDQVDAVGIGIGPRHYDWRVLLFLYVVNAAHSGAAASARVAARDINAILEKPASSASVVQDEVWDYVCKGQGLYGYGASEHK